MRQDPDVIMVGEMRDLETIATVMTAAETGHLVFSTLHTNNAAQTIDRIIDAFPAEQHKQIRAQLSLVLRGIISLKLVKTADGGLTAAVEILKNSPKIAKLIEDGHTKDILEEMEGSVGYYRMQSMNQSPDRAARPSRITYEDAMELSSDPGRPLAEDPEDVPRKSKSAPEPEDPHMPSRADFSQIIELMEIKRLYEEQEENFRNQLLREGRGDRAGCGTIWSSAPGSSRRSAGRERRRTKRSRASRRARAPPRRRPGEDPPAPGADQGAEPEADGGGETVAGDCRS